MWYRPDMEKPSSSHMMEALRAKLGGHAPFKAALQEWRAANPIPNSGGQWPPMMDAVEALYRLHFPAKIPPRTSV